MFCRRCGIEMGAAHAQHVTWHKAQDQELLALRRQVLALHTEVRSMEDELGRFRAMPASRRTPVDPASTPSREGPVTRS